MSELIVLVGPPGCGKTTLSKEYEQQGFVRISQDDMGKETYLNHFYTALKHSDNIVVDRLNFSREQRDRFLVPAKERLYKTKIIVLHENYDTCLKRCEQRDDHPTIRTKENALNALSMFFKKYEKPTIFDADEVNYKYPELKVQCKTLICDIDGTLANINHRLHFVKQDKKDWKSFFNDISKDEVNKWCLDIIRGLRDKYIITLCSGRPDDYRDITLKWLEDNRIPYDHLFMRNKGDFRQDYIIKQNLLDFEIKTRYNIGFAIDDRLQVVEMLRNNGITVLQCDKGEF